MSRDEGSLSRELEARGLSRREFVGWCSGIAVVLGLPRSAGAAIASALEIKQKPSLIWLEFQGCTGDSESFLRASKPTAAEVILDLLSIDYHETIMAASGKRAEAARDAVIKGGKPYVVVIEGSIPAGADGAYCTIGGKSALQIARDACANAAAVIAVGSCAAYGGLPAASPNPTEAMSVADAVPGLKTLINMPACPVNTENLTALIAYWLTYNRWPALDDLGRPLFAHGKAIHDACQRRAHFDAGQYVEQFGDQGHRLGYCLYKMGCKGPVTFHNCPSIGWSENTSWPVACGHPCIGCSEPAFWDRMTPFYSHLSGIPGFGAAADIDKIGLYATGAVVATFSAHALVQITKRAIDKRRGKPATEPPSPEEPPAPDADADVKKDGAS